jgi:hypothetical protein
MRRLYKPSDDECKGTVSALMHEAVLSLHRMPLFSQELVVTVTLTSTGPAGWEGNAGPPESECNDKKRDLCTVGRSHSFALLESRRVCLLILQIDAHQIPQQIVSPCKSSRVHVHFATPTYGICGSSNSISVHFWVAVTHPTQRSVLPCPGILHVSSRCCKWSCSVCCIYKFPKMGQATQASVSLQPF